MRIEQFLKDKGISLYSLAKRSGLSYSVVHNLVSGKSDIRKCNLDTAQRISNALDITMEEFMLLCDNRYTFTWFRSEQCHMVHRKGEMQYLIDVLENKEIDRYWRLSMYAEALYELAMIDHICKVNGVPICGNYNEMRSYKLDRVSYPIDAEIKNNLLKDKDALDAAERGALEEFRKYNIVEEGMLERQDIR